MVLGVEFTNGLALSKSGAARWYDADNSNFVGLQAPGAVTADMAYTLPSGPPAADGQVLASTRAGVMSWVTQTGGGSGEVNTASNQGGGVGLFWQKIGVDLQFKTLAAAADEAGQRTASVAASGTNQVAVRAYGVAPVGAVIAWLQNLAGVPSTLPDGFVVCDGRTIADAGSPLNGVTIPNLVNFPSDTNHQIGANRFLRGDTVSGRSGGSETHHHTLSDVVSLCSGSGSLKSAAAATQTDDFPTLPTYYSVVWIMRIK